MRASMVCAAVILLGCRTGGLSTPNTLAADGGSPTDGSTVDGSTRPTACGQATSEEECRALPGCTAATCPGCLGQHAYLGCLGPNDGAWQCPLIKCPASCAQLAESDCRASGACHPVFRDPGTCDCALPGCCMVFSQCGDGDKAACSGQAACERAEPACGGAYTLAYQGTCYEGCVLKSDCQ